MQALADVRAGRSAAALSALERALAIRTKTASAPTDLAYTRFDLAKALVATGGDKRRARELAEQAHADLERAGQAADAAEVAAWLKASAR